MKGLSRESRTLIDAARDGDNPSAADRRRVRAGLARKIALGAAAGTIAVTASQSAAGAAAGGTSSVAAGTVAASGGIGAGGAAAGLGGGGSIAGAIATGLGAKILVSVAIVGAVSAGSVGYVRYETAKRVAANVHVVAVEQPLPAAAPVKIGKAPSSSLGVPPVASTVSPPRAVREEEVHPAAPGAAPKAVSANTASNVPVVAATPSDLDVEIALLQEANGAVREKDGARALRLLGEYTRRFPSGALAEEAEAARVFALCQIGRTDEAHDVAGRFLREHPHSPLAQRVSRACDETPPTF